VIAAAAMAVFAVLTVIVTTSAPLAFDSHAFRVAGDLRAPWLDGVARVITTLGLFAIVGPAVAIGAALLVWTGERARPAALVAGTAAAWTSDQIAKAAVGRPRPPAPLVQTTGHSYPSGHAVNSVGWLALALVLAAVIPSRTGRTVVVAGGAVIVVVVGMSRIYLRAHYASDVIAGVALATAIYALAAIASIIYAKRGSPGASRRSPRRADGG
jgi:undecaprenyl-diphosphatase